MLIPEFSENLEKSIVLFFNADNADTKKLCDEIERTYVCFTKMNTVLKDGHKYVAVEMDSDE